MSDGRLRDRVAVVTGSTRGLGRAIAERFAAEGARVVINARDAEAAETAARELGGATLAVAADLGTEAGCAELFERTLAECGRIDVLVNNAGTTVSGPAEGLPLADWQRIIDLDLTGPFLCCQHAARAMLESGKGSIVNIASVAATTTPPKRVAYVAAKAGLIGMTKVMAAEWAPKVRVNTISPSYFETSLVAELIGKGLVDRSVVEGRSPYARLGRPSEVASAALFLASDESEYITGVDLPVDGGWLVFGQNL